MTAQVTTTPVVARPAAAAVPPRASDAAAATAYGDLDIAAQIAALRGLALASVTAALDTADQRPPRGWPRWLHRLVHGFLPPRRIDRSAIAALWPVVVAPALAGRRRHHARAMLRAPLPGQQPPDHDLDTVPDAVPNATPELAVMAAAAVMRPRLADRAALVLMPTGGVVGGAALLSFAAAAALRHPAVVATVDGLLRRRLAAEVLLPRRSQAGAATGTDPITLSDRGLVTLIAMALVPRRRGVDLPTRRRRFERALAGRAVALWDTGEVPRGFEAWLFTAVLVSRGKRMDPRLAALARSAGLGGCPRFAAAATDAPDTADYAAMPEPLARFLRREF